MTFTERLKEMRKCKGLSQQQIASVCRVPTATYINWELGRAKTPINYIPVLCDILCISSDYLFGISKNQSAERLAFRVNCLSKDWQKILLKLIDKLSKC